MKPFHQWTRDLADSLETDKTGIPEELEGHEDPDAEGGYTYPCRVCGEDSPIVCNPEDWFPDMHYCGRSPMCCP